MFGQDNIQIPPQFVETWKLNLDDQKYGWFKDPADTYLRVDTTRIMNENVIPGGKAIALHCGFNAPHKVILCYQVVDNLFYMRIVDDEGQDIPWFGAHHPTNYHAMKLADPSFVVPIGFKSLVEPGKNEGETSMPLPYDLFNDRIRQAQEDQAVAGFFEIGNEPIHVAAGNGKPEEYIWTIKVTKSVAEGKSVMVSLNECLQMLFELTCIQFTSSHSNSFCYVFYTAFPCFCCRQIRMAL